MAEGRVLGFGPDPSSILADQTGQRSGDRGKVRDEASVPRCDAQELANLLETGRGGPIGDCAHLRGICSDLLPINIVSQVLQAIGRNGTCLRSAVVWRLADAGKLRPGVPGARQRFSWPRCR